MFSAKFGGWSERCQSNKELTQESTRQTERCSYIRHIRLDACQLNFYFPSFLLLFRSPRRNLQHFWTQQNTVGKFVLTCFYPCKGGVTGKLRERTLGTCRTDRLCPGPKDMQKGADGNAEPARL